MKIGIITSIKAPYRTLQIEEIVKNSEFNITVYYTEKGKEDREWNVDKSKVFKEIYLKKILKFNKYGALNSGLKNIVKENDIIILGGYEKPTYIILAMLCKIYKKKYGIIFDGISIDKIKNDSSILKKMIKKYVIKNSNAIWGNGTVSKIYFRENFNYPEERIYNQYLTVDGKKISEIGLEKIKIREYLRNYYGIDKNDKVIHYSGRLVKVKNIGILIKAISKIKDEKITLLITGGGVEEKYLKELAKKLKVKIIITGFISNQENLFKHYYISDLFILPSLYEPWGLVVNEAMFAGLPIIVSDICGCSLDLVKNNGYIFKSNDINDLIDKIRIVLHKDNYLKMGEDSKRIIEKWNFYKSKCTFENMIYENLK